MVAHQLAAVAVCAALVAAPAGAELRADPAPQPSTVSSTVPGATQAERPAYVPCPGATVPGPAGTPPAPSLPPLRDPAAPVIGGEGLGTAGLALPPGVNPPAPLPARAWLVADLDTGAVLGACGPHERHPPASVQKLLLAATVLPRADPAQVVEVTKADMDFEVGSSAVGLLVGGRYTVETLWLGLMLNSGNDAANVLARVGGGPGGVPGTIEAMNAEARRLGAYDTHAVTPSGLDGPGQATSVYDLALIARACFAREDFRRYNATLRAQIPAQPPKTTRGFQIQNDNQLLLQYPGALGGKTGFTDLARHTYVGMAERNGRRLVVTILSAETRPMRSWQQGAALLDWGFGLPRDGAVGRLVGPGEVGDARRSSAPQPRAGAVAGTAARRALGAGGTTTLAVAGAGMLVAATAATATAVGLARRRRRGRRPSAR